MTFLYLKSNFFEFCLKIEKYKLWFLYSSFKNKIFELATIRFIQVLFLCVRKFSDFWKLVKKVLKIFTLFLTRFYFICFYGERGYLFAVVQWNVERNEIFWARLLHVPSCGIEHVLQLILNSAWLVHFLKIFKSLNSTWEKREYWKRTSKMPKSDNS